MLKAKIKDAFSRSYYYYGNLLCHKIESNMFTMILALTDRVVVMTHWNLGKYWKLFQATLIGR